jgi:hypothetical protein
LFKAAVLVLAGAALTATGCVLVVDGNGGTRRADVEWASDRDHGTTARRSASTGATIADGTLARQVEGRIQEDASLAGEDITISSSGDIVTLHGRVSDIARLERVMQIAAGVPGVARVVSRLTVELETG